MDGFKYLLCALIIAISAQSLSGKNSQPPFKVKLNARGQFIDNFGRVRMFHGLNNVEKGFPWYDDQMLNNTRLQLYKEWGFNIVRLGCMWSGLQPSEDSYNSTYINILLRIVSNLGKFGLYSLLDMHQDVLSSKFDGYDGVPLWLVDKFPNVPDVLQFPFPFNRNKTYFWPTYYFTYAASFAFQELYSSEVGLHNWETIWGKIASIFVHEPSVIGYELLNEPWLGNFYEEPMRILPGYAGRNNLLPAYDRLTRNIRKFDNDTLIFYEPVTYGSYAPSTGDLGTGFDKVPGGPAEKLKSVLSYHFYCFFISTANPAKDYPSWLKIVCDDLFAKQLFQSTAENVNITGGGSLLTEFGGCQPDGNEKSINTIECDAVLKLADEHYQSFTYWDSIFFKEDGSVKTSVVKTFARGYPRAVQGQPLQYSFDRISGVMTLVYIVDIGIPAPTEIFLPMTVHYKSGFKNETTPSMRTDFDGLNFIFSIQPLPSTKQGTRVVVNIRPVN